MSDITTTRPPPPPKRVDLAREELRKARPFVREERGTAPGEAQIAHALAGVEGRLLSKIEDLREETQGRPSVVIQAPAPSSEKKHWTTSVGTILAGVLTACAALVAAIAGLVAQLRHEPASLPGLAASAAACASAQATFERAVKDQFAKQNHYDATQRRLVRGAFGAQGISFPYAADEPLSGESVQILPAPLLDPHRVSKAARVQLSEPLPIPPEFDSPKP